MFLNSEHVVAIIATLDINSAVSLRHCLLVSQLALSHLFIQVAHALDIKGVIDEFLFNWLRLVLLEHSLRAWLVRVINLLDLDASKHRITSIVDCVESALVVNMFIFRAGTVAVLVRVVLHSN